MLIMCVCYMKYFGFIVYLSISNFKVYGALM